MSFWITWSVMPCGNCWHRFLILQRAKTRTDTQTQVNSGIKFSFSSSLQTYFVPPEHQSFTSYFCIGSGVCTQSVFCSGSGFCTGSGLFTHSGFCTGSGVLTVGQSFSEMFGSFSPGHQAEPGPESLGGQEKNRVVRLLRGPRLSDKNPTNSSSDGVRPRFCTHHELT